MEQCPKDFMRKKHEYAKRIYLATISKWNENKFALGDLVREIGKQGEINAEMQAFLLQIGIDFQDFTHDVLSDLPRVPKQGWEIPAAVSVTFVFFHGSKLTLAIKR